MVAVVLVSMSVLTSAGAADLLTPRLSLLQRDKAFGGICPTPPWYRGWSRIAPFVCGE